MTEKQAALVTGASRGIGAAIADQLIQDGYFVIGTATSQAGVDKLNERFGENGVGYELNLSNLDTLPAFEKLVLSHKPVVQVHNAGITLDNIVLRLKTEDIVRVVNTNLVGPFALAKGLLKPMLKAKTGRIIFLGSVTASMGNAGQTVYTASKAGLGGLTRSLAKELGSRGITVNLVEPGFVSTDMTSVLGEEVLAEAVKQVPLGKLSEPSDIANLVSFLVSDKASYISGETLAINGGLYMK